MAAPYLQKLQAAATTLPPEQLPDAVNQILGGGAQIPTAIAWELVGEVDPSFSYAHILLWSVPRSSTSLLSLAA
jgi:hypothetical protein